MFIITFDKSHVESVGGALSQAPLQQTTALEVEVELDRSTLTDLLTVADWPADQHEGRERVRRAASDFSYKALRAMEADLQAVKTLINEVVAQEFGLSRLPMDYKYRRFGSLIQKSRTPR